MIAPFYSSLFRLIINKKSLWSEKIDRTQLSLVNRGVMRNYVYPQFTKNPIGVTCYIF